MPLEPRPYINIHPPMTFDASLALTHPATRAAHEFWETRRKHRTMPARADLDHGGMRKFIAHVGLVACTSTPGSCEYRIRLAGSEWEAVFGPMTGRRLAEFLTPDIEARWLNVFDDVCGARRPLRVSTLLGFKGKTWLSAELFIAPLSDDDKNVSMLFLCFAATNLARGETAAFATLEALQPI